MKNDETQHNYDAVVRRVEKNGKNYTVRLERWLHNRDDRAIVDGKRSGRPMQGTVFSVLPIDKVIVQTPNLPDAMNGVLLTDYQIMRDDDPTWRAWITLGGDPVYGNESWAEDAHVYVARVEILRGRKPLDSTTLPMAELLRACVKCGHVALERDGKEWKLVYDDNGYPMPAAQYDRLVRRRKRERSEVPDDARILELCEEHRLMKDAYRRGELLEKPPLQHEYVAASIDYAPSYAADLIKLARKRAGETKSKKKGK
jgi:hypothetical protein